MRIGNFLHRFLLHVYYISSSCCFPVPQPSAGILDINIKLRMKKKTPQEKISVPPRSPSNMAPDMAGHGVGPLRLVDVLIHSKGFGGDTNLEPGNPEGSMESVGWKNHRGGGCFVMGPNP